ncbi:MAG: response regulator [Sulfitobacter sp.]
MRILTVDDDPVILDMVPVIFRDTGHAEVTTAESGQAALDLLGYGEARFDCILLDIAMPQMSGIELCQRIRARPEYAFTPIIMLTGQQDQPSIEGAFAAGATDYITKPFEIRNVVDRVQIAERMLKNTDQALALNPVDMDPDTADGEHPFTISDPLFITDAEQMIQPFSLGNYLAQLSRRRIDECFVFAVTIANIKDLYDFCSTKEFAVALSEVSDVISQSIQSTRQMNAYMGDGAFVSISAQEISDLWPEIATTMQEKLDASAAVYDDGRAMEITLSVGRPLHPNASSNTRVKRTFDRAIARSRPPGQSRLRR